MATAIYLSTNHCKWFEIKTNKLIACVAADIAIAAAFLAIAGCTQHIVPLATTCAIAGGTPLISMEIALMVGNVKKSRMLKKLATLP